MFLLRIHSTTSTPRITTRTIRKEVNDMTQQNYEAPAILDVADDNEFAVAPGLKKPSDHVWDD